MLDFHERYQQREFKSYWDGIAETFPELAKDAQCELAWLTEIKQERDRSIDEPDLDQLLTGLNSVERYLRAFVTAEIKQLEQEGIYITRDNEPLEHAMDEFNLTEQPVVINLFGHCFEETREDKADQREDIARHNREER